ncbi:MAG: hypothetical protein U9N00_04430 [Candidatus Bipolaricaulota bacterium]|nr:hypothetical protein [Candidatus Bipolaricaulota bacterium]
MGEIFVQRDEKNRIFGLVGREMEEGSPATTGALQSLRVASTSMTEYLHLSPEFKVGKEEISLIVDRSAPHLNREIATVMETLVVGLKMLAEEYPDDLVVHEAPAMIRV